MKEELVKELSEKTGLSPDKAQEAVEFVINHLMERLPGPLSNGLQDILNGGSAQGGDLAGEVRSTAAMLGGFFHKSE
jgi:hypothetical protein